MLLQKMQQEAEIAGLRWTVPVPGPQTQWFALQPTFPADCVHPLGTAE